MPILSGVVGSGCVSNHSARAGTVGSMPAFRHHAASSPQRWTSRWCPRHNGTVNSSLTLRPKRAALGKSQMVGFAGSSTTNQARMLGDRSDVIPVTTRRGSGSASTLLSMAFVPCRILVFSAFGPRGLRRAAAGLFGCVSGSSAGEAARVASLAWKASSTPWLSGAVSLFFSPRDRCAQIAASSAR